MREAAPEGADVEIELIASAPAALVQPDDPAIALGQDAFERVIGARPLLIRIGGSLPVMAALERPADPDDLDRVRPARGEHSLAERALPRRLHRARRRDRERAFPLARRALRPRAAGCASGGEAACPRSGPVEGSGEPGGSPENAVARTRGVAQSHGGGLKTQRPPTIVATTSTSRQLLRGDRERVAVEHDEVGQVPGEQLPALPFLAREPGRREDRRLQRLLDRDRLLRMPRLALVERAEHPGARSRPAARAPRSVRRSRSRPRHLSRAASGRRMRGRSSRPSCGPRCPGRTGRG